MKIAVGLFAVLLAMALGAQETLVPPPQLDQVAKAHHCFPVVRFEADQESNQDASYDVHYEFHFCAT
jgi:hypothetical protein